MLEFLIMIPFALVIILGMIQLALVFNAHSMMKLAAFNAARTAVVAHGAKPEDPATVKDALKAAERAAKLTLLPVIPAFHGFTPSLNGIQQLIQNNVNPGSVSNSAGAVAMAAIELFVPSLGGIRVDFLNRTDAIDRPAIQNWKNRIDFDDPRKADDNVIKVRVSWDYPLVIPYVNRIFTAITRPDLYLLDRLTSGQPVTPELIFNNKPAWDYADFLAGNGALSAIPPYFLLRWPMRSTAIMRTQWDRKQN
jgi:hypothetical protein